MNNLKENISSLKSGLERLIRNHTVLKSEYEINKNQLDALRQALAEKICNWQSSNDNSM